MGLIRTILIAFAVAGWCAACGGGGSAGDTPPPVTMLSISTISLPPASEGVAYPATALQASGGTSPYTWTITSGALPAGMSLSTDGTLSGTAAATGSWNFIVQATDASRNSNTASLTLMSSLFVPTAWTPSGVDYGLKKQCIRTIDPSALNFFADTTDCPGSAYPVAAYWTTAVETEEDGGSLCLGSIDQSYLINGAGSPVTETWTGTSVTGYSVELKTDFTDVANCGPRTFTWVPFMDNQAGGGPLPPPNSLVTSYTVNLNRNLPAGSGATRAFAEAEARWDIAVAGGAPISAHFGVEVNFFIDQPVWGVQSGQPADVISVRQLPTANPPNYFVALDGSKLIAPITAPLGANQVVTVNWGAIWQHLVDEGLIPPPVNGWSNSNAASTANAVGTEVQNAAFGSGGPMIDLVVTNYQEGSF